MDNKQHFIVDDKALPKHRTRLETDLTLKLSLPICPDDGSDKEISDAFKAMCPPTPRNHSASKRYPGFLLSKPIAKRAESKSGRSEEKMNVDSDVKSDDKKRGTRHENSDNDSLTSDFNSDSSNASDSPDKESRPEDYYSPCP